MTPRARCVALYVALLPAAASAQWGGSVLLESDQRFRGVSLSDGEPSARVTLLYDHADGAYAGLSASRYRFADDQPRATVMGYAGYSSAATATARWEAGLTWTAIEQYADDYRPYDYGEVYAGLLGEWWSLRLYASPHYFGGEQSLYAEANANWPLLDDWRLALHIGGLNARHDGQGMRADLRAGVVWQINGFDLQLAWTGVQQGGPPPNAYEGKRNTLLFSAAYSF